MLKISASLHIPSIILIMKTQKIHSTYHVAENETAVMSLYEVVSSSLDKRIIKITKRSSSCQANKRHIIERKICYNHNYSLNQEIQWTAK